MSDLMEGFGSTDANTPAATTPTPKPTRRVRSKEEILADLDRQEQKIKARREAVLNGRATVRFTLGTPEEKADFNRYVLAIGKAHKLSYAQLAAVLENAPISALDDEAKESLKVEGQAILQEHHRERQPRKPREA